jgi:AP-3 complex subunit delta-1
MTLLDWPGHPYAAVQSAAVNVICELARKNPQNYLSLAPALFRLLDAQNNWMVIKIIKLVWGYGFYDRSLERGTPPPPRAIDVIATM